MFTMMSDETECRAEDSHLHLFSLKMCAQTQGQMSKMVNITIVQSLTKVMKVIILMTCVPY